MKMPVHFLSLAILTACNSPTQLLPARNEISKTQSVASSSQELINTSWMLVDFPGRKLSRMPSFEDNFSMVFDAKEVSGRIGVNSYYATYTRNDDKLEIASLTQTEVFQTEIDAAGGYVLSQTRRYKISRDILQLFDSANNLLANLKRN